MWTFEYATHWLFLYTLFFSQLVNDLLTRAVAGWQITESVKPRAKLAFSK